MSTGPTTIDADAASFYRLLHARTPRLVVTPVLLGAIVVVYVLMVATSGELAFSTPTVTRWGAQHAPAIADGEYWRLLTAMFLHGNVLHLGLNAICLWRLGPFVERLLGPTIYLALYLLCGVVAAATSLQFGDGAAISVGASGAIFGVAGVLLAIVATAGGSPRDLLRPRVTTLGGGLTETPSEPPPLPAPHRSMAGILAEIRGSLVAFVLYNGAIGFLVPMIDNAAHMGGLVAGLVFGWIVGRHSLAAKPHLVRTLLPVAVAVGLAAGEVAVLSHRATIEMERGRLELFEARADDLFSAVGAEIDAGRRPAAAGADEVSRTVTPGLRDARARGEVLAKTTAARFQAARALDQYGRQVDWRHARTYGYDAENALAWLAYLGEHSRYWQQRLEAMRRNQPWLQAQARRRLRAAERRLETYLGRPRPQPVD